MIAKLFIYFNSEKKSPLLAFIKFEPTFLTGSLAVCLSAPVQGETGGRGGWGEFRPPSPARSVRIFSNRHRQLGNEVIGSPATRLGRRRSFGRFAGKKFPPPHPLPFLAARPESHNGLTESFTTTFNNDIITSLWSLIKTQNQL